MVLNGAEDLYTAGQLAPPGRYRRLEPPSEHTLVLNQHELLPASLDGRVALYRRLPTAPRPLQQPLRPARVRARAPAD